MQRLRRVLVALAAATIIPSAAPLFGQLDASWTVRIGTTNVRPDERGLFTLPNISARDNNNDGESDLRYRVKAVSHAGGVTRYAYSQDRVRIRNGELGVVDSLELSPVPLRTPERLSLAGGGIVAPGEAIDLSVLGNYADGSSEDVTRVFTEYTSSNPDIATVDASGRVTGVSRGAVFVTASHEGVTSVTRVDVASKVETVTIEGFVALADGSPAAGATVMTSFGGSVQTDENGFFSITIAVPLGAAPALTIVFDDGGETLQTTITPPLAGSGLITDVGTVTVFPVANPSSLFGARRFPASNIFTRRPLASDVDADGDVDVILPGTANNLLVFPNNGDGTFQPPNSTPTTVQQYNHIAGGDVDGDGDDDVVLVDFAFNQWQVVVMTNDGAGQFSVGAAIPTGENSYSAAVGDIDGDGLAELLVAHSRGGPGARIAIWERGGDGSYTFRDEVGDTWARPERVLVADLDGDTWNDVLVLHEGSSDTPLSILWGDGLGGLLPAGIPLEAGLYPETMELGDLDGDGDLDIYTGSRDAVTFFNEGARMFSRVESFEARFLRDIALADIDADGDLDYLGTTQIDGADVVTTHWNAGDGSVERSSFHPSDRNSESILARDFDGDGTVDVVVVSRTALNVLLNPQGEGPSPLPASYAAGEAPFDVELDDVDADGDLDALTLTGTQTGCYAFAIEFGVVPGDGAGGFEAPVVLDLEFEIRDMPRGMALGDTDGDGDSDVAMLLTYYDNDAGDWRSAIRFARRDEGGFALLEGFVYEGELEALALGDLDGDGRAEIVASEDSSPDAILVFPNLGDSAFGEPTSIVVASGRPGPIVLADLDGDFDLDAAATSSGNAVIVLINDGGTFAPPVELAVTQSTVLGAGDVNGDGTIDLVNASNLGVDVLLNDGSANFVVLTSDLGFTPRDMKLSDVDGDGDLDVAFLFSPPGVGVVINDGTGGFGAPIDFVLPGRDAAAFEVADMDADGDGDLVLTYPGGPSKCFSTFGSGLKVVTNGAR